jgi:hypothetical protein
MADTNTTKTQDTTQPPAKEKLPMWERMLNIVAYPISAAVGYYVGDASIRRSIYTNFAKRKHFVDLQTIQDTAIKAVMDEAKHNPAVNLSTAIHGINETYRQSVKSRFESWGMRGITDYWKGLHRNQKIEAIGLAITVSGIALGAMLTMSDHMDRFRESVGLDTQKDKEKDKTSSISR